jgi:hypothetical protein
VACFCLREEVLTLRELSNLLFVLQKEKSRFSLESLLDAEENESWFLFFFEDLLCGCTQYRRGYSY